MIYLDLIKLELKSFNIIEQRFFKQKLIHLNYISFFINFKFLFNLYNQLKILSNLIFYLKKIIKQFLKIKKVKSIFYLLHINFTSSFNVLLVINSIINKYNLIKQLINIKKYQFQFYLNLLNKLTITITKLPIKLKKFTILKSPHIFKKHRDQYQINYYKYFTNFIIFDKSNQFYNIFNNLRFQSFIESSLIIKTFIKND